MEFFHPRRNVNANEVYEMLLNIISMWGRTESDTTDATQQQQQQQCCKSICDFMIQ